MSQGSASALLRMIYVHSFRDRPDRQLNDILLTCVTLVLSSAITACAAGIDSEWSGLNGTPISQLVYMDQYDSRPTDIKAFEARVLVEIQQLRSDRGLDRKLAAEAYGLKCMDVRSAIQCEFRAELTSTPVSSVMGLVTERSTPKTGIFSVQYTSNIISGAEMVRYRKLTLGGVEESKDDR